jgi:hypothetical protein
VIKIFNKYNFLYEEIILKIHFLNKIKLILKIIFDGLKIIENISKL